VTDGVGGGIAMAGFESVLGARVVDRLLETCNYMLKAC
jgi:hypothetical protein